MLPSRPADRDDVRTLLEQCVAAWHEHGPRAADALLAATPELAEPVRDGLAALARAGLLDDEEPSRLPERIGGYRVLELLGRGGMGAVFRAHDDASDRDVAVKVVHPQLLWYGRARERFEREIRALARIAHRGAVPIYHFGDDAGVPFFVMEYVAGRSLATILAAVAGRNPNDLTRADLDSVLAAAPPTQSTTASEPWWRALVLIAAQVADTLHHVHQHGIVHRDVKPSNILVTPAGDARLVDFGLARIDGDVALTRVPTTLGSDPYMAPEQTADRGGAVDARSDVFALGATLFEALSLQPPFGGGGARTRERIVAGDHPALRTLLPQVPRDLDAVCAVAIAPEPHRRYQSAGAFADDLRAVLGGRPVAARPIGTLARSWRLVRRHPLTAAALATTLLVAVAAPTWIAVQQYETSRSIAAALARAERNRDHALDAIDRLLARIAQDRLFELPEAEGVRRRLLQDAIEVQEAMLRDTPQDARVALDTAAGKRRLCELHLWLGDRVAADRHLEEALTILRAIPAVPAIELARALAIRARVAGELGDPARARVDLGEAIDVLERALSAATGPDARAAFERATAERRIELAIVEGTLGDNAAAEQSLAAALTTLRNLPEDRRTLQAIGSALGNGVRTAVYRGNSALGVSFATASIDAYTRALAKDPDDWDLMALRAHIQGELSKVVYMQGNAAEALTHGLAGHDTLAALHPRHSQVLWLTHHLAQAKLALADAYLANTRNNDASRTLDEALVLLRELVRRDPRSVAMREALGRSLGLRAQLTTYTHEALPLLEEAQQLFETLQREDPENPLPWRQLMVVYISRASLERTAGDHEREAAWFDIAIAASRSWQEKKLPPAREILATLLLDRADCAARADDPELARDFVREAMTLARVPRDQLDKRAGLADLLATPAFAELFR